MSDATPRSILLVIERLTPREGEVLDELAKGKTNAQIAVTLVIAGSTVRAHVSNILGKLDVHTRTEAVLAAQELGLVAMGGQPEPEVAAMLVLERLAPGAWAKAGRVIAGEGDR